MITETSRRRVSEQRRGAQQLRSLAKLYRFRVVADAEGFPMIPGRYGHIEWFCDGVNCWSCALPRQFALAVYTDRPRLFQRLRAIPGVKRHQTGDTEMRGVFPLEVLEQVAPVIRAKRWGGTGRGRDENFAFEARATDHFPATGDDFGGEDGSRAWLRRLTRKRAPR